MRRKKWVNNKNQRLLLLLASVLVVVSAFSQPVLAEVG